VSTKSFLTASPTCIQKNTADSKAFAGFLLSDGKCQRFDFFILNSLRRMGDKNLGERTKTIFIEVTFEHSR
jgi:hypothetical protein